MAYNFIICEYNPLHNGHIYHIASNKINANDKVICIMSGNCVQRGELAIIDKYTRASWAIKAGADLVIELPSRFVLSPAQIFALGGAKIISHFNENCSLSFGSEIGNIDILKQLANIVDSPETDLFIKEFLDKGNAYPKALSLAVEKYCEKNYLKDIHEILENPNNTLGLEYLRAIKKCNCNCECKTLLRENNYNDNDIKGNFASASAIRNHLEDTSLINKYCPDFVSENLKKIKPYEEALFSLLKYNLSQAVNWKNIVGCDEGIENRIVEKLDTSNSYQELIEAIKSKRYTLARIKRLLLNGLINNTYSSTNLIENDINYIKVLAIKKSAKDLLSKFNIPIITSSGDYISNNIKEDFVDTNIDRLFNSLCYNYKPKFNILD